MKLQNPLNDPRDDFNGSNDPNEPSMPSSDISSSEIRIDLSELDDAKAIFTGEELLLRGVETVPCLLEPLLPRVGVVALAGSSDTGKSCLARQFAMAVCLKAVTFLGWILNAIHGKAIYVSSEDDDYALAFLMKKSNKSFKREPEAYKGLKFVIDTHDLHIKLDQMLRAEKVDLIIIDVFTDLYGRSMTEANQVRTFLNIYAELAKQHQCLILFLHHCGKRTEEQPPSKNNLLGSQGFESKMRTVIELRADKGDPTKRHLCIVKGNYLPGEFKNQSFILEFDDSMCFANTDERAYFDELGSSNNTAPASEIRALHEQGKTQIEIAKLCNCSQSKVSKALKKKPKG